VSALLSRHADKLTDDGRYVRVRGHAKVFCHLMFGVLALAIGAFVRSCAA